MLGSVRSLAFAVVAVGLLLVGACKTQLPVTTAVLQYEDFGPPSMVYELLGQGWWQWQDHGDSDPGKHYDIHVVVYRGVTLEEAKRRYPSVPDAEADYRYVPFEDAMRHLDEQIPIAAEELPTLAERLRATRREILSRFESKQ
jgi:hypothetical protein